MKMPSVRLFPLLTLAGVALLLTSVSARATTVYSDITTFSGSGFAGAGTATSGGTTSTALVADDINFAAGAAGQQVNSFTFSAANFNSTAVGATAMVRFYSNNGTGGGPGTFLTGLNFNLALGASGVSTFTYSPGTSIFTIPTSNSIWAAIAFSGTALTTAQLNNLGQGLYNPPTVGSSSDAFFQSSAGGGTFTSDNPGGGFFFFGGSPVANFGWAFQTAAVASVPDAGSSAMLLGLGLAGLLGAERVMRSRRLTLA